MLEEKLNTVTTDSSAKTFPLGEHDDVKQVYPEAFAVNDQENDKMLKLYKQGFSEKQIAKVLQIDLGEVELVLKYVQEKAKLSKVE